LRLFICTLIIGRNARTNRYIPRYRPLPQKGDFIQILNLANRAHWITIAGNCELKPTIQIDVYDSLNSNIVDQELISQVSSFFRCHEGIEYLEFVFHNVTHQVDGSACGVHAIANAIVACNSCLLPSSYARSFGLNHHEWTSLCSISK